MNFTEIKEENLRLYIPKESSAKKNDDVFFNPEAKLSRDLALIFAEVLRPKKAFDLTAGSGAMGLRIAKNVNLNEMILVDVNSKAVECAEKNIKLNRLKNCRALKMHAEDVDVSDSDFSIIDPFGSPAKIFKKIIKKMKTGSFILLKGTDFGTLSGRYPGKAKNNYGLEIRKNNLPHETSIRTMLLFAEREANKNKKSIKPLFAYSTSYYTSVLLKIIDRQKTKTGFLNYCERCKYTKTGKKTNKCICGLQMKHTEIWHDEKCDKLFIKKMMRKFWNYFDAGKKIFDFKEVSKLTAKAEKQNLFDYVYSLPEFCRKHSLKMPNTKLFSNSALALPFDDETFTTWKKPDAFLKIIRNMDK